MVNISLLKETPLTQFKFTNYAIIALFAEQGYRWKDGFYHGKEPIPRYEATEKLALLIRTLHCGVDELLEAQTHFEDENEKDKIKTSLRSSAASKLNDIDRLLKLCESHPDMQIVEEPKQLRSYSVADAMALAITEPKCVFPGLVKGTVGMLVGRTKLGKSFLALELGLSVATGRELLSGLAPEKGKALLLLGEDNWEYVTGLRLRNMCVRFGLKDVPDLEIIPQQVQPFVTADGDSAVGTEALKELEERITQGSFTFCVIDSFARFLPGDENGQSRETQALQLLEGVAERTGCAILLIHHCPKLDNERALTLASVRGASAIAATVRTVFGLEKPQKDEAGDVKLSLLGSNCFGYLPPVFLKREATGILSTFDAEGERAKAVEEAMLALIPLEGKRKSDLMKEGLTGLKPSKEEREQALRNLIAEGRLTEVSRGRFQVAAGKTPNCNLNNEAA